MFWAQDVDNTQCTGEETWGFSSLGLAYYPHTRYFCLCKEFEKRASTPAPTLVWLGYEQVVTL